MSERWEFCRLAVEGEIPFAELCRRFGISRPTGYLWLARWREQGPDGLVDRSKRPVRSPNRTPVAVAEAVCELRRQHPRWGGRKIAAVLARRGVSPAPAPSTVTGILRRHGLVDPVAPSRDYVRFEHDAPNRLWQMDFKGWFGLSDATRCHTLGVLDDHSRYNLVLAACSDERTATVSAQLTGAFRRYGLPERILCDNGSPWGNDRHQPWTPLGVWLLDLGVGVVHSRPFHPQTAGKEERFHLTLDWEVISTRPLWHDHGQVQAAYDRWRVVYNQQRPHEALGMAVPADRYQPSGRSFPDHVPPVDYPDGFAVRKHNGRGIHYQGRRFPVPKAFAGRYLGITPTTPNGVYHVWYRHQIITTINFDTHDL